MGSGRRRDIEISLRKLGTLGQVGPDVRDIRDGFDPTDAVTAYPMVENHDTNLRKGLVTEANKYLAPLAQPRPGRKLKQVDQLWPKAAQLLIAERLETKYNRVVAMRVDRRVLSNVWWEVSVENALTEKALAVWLNSSLGLLTIMAQRTSNRGKLG